MNLHRDDRMIINVTEELDGTFSADATWLPGSPPVARDMPSEHEAIKRLLELIVNDRSYAKYLTEGEEYCIERYVRYKGAVVGPALHNEEFIPGFVPGKAEDAVTVDVQLGGPVQPPSSFEAPCDGLTEGAKHLLSTIVRMEQEQEERKVALCDTLSRLIETALTYPPGDLRSLAEEVRDMLAG